VNKKRTILAASLAILAALLFAGAAQPQALIVGTEGQAGDNSQVLEPVTASLGNDDASGSASVGEGQGSAATADVQKDTDSGNAVVGCIDASAASGDNGGSLSVGNCGGDGSAGGASLGDGAAGGVGGAGIDLGCIVADLFGVGSGGAQVGSCEDGAGNGGGGADEEGGAAGDIGGNADEDQGSGVAGADAGAGAGVDGGDGSEGGQGDGEPCGTFAQTSALTGSGVLPLWVLGVAAIAAFGLGTVFARRRTKEVDPTG
jgi:hypothetical protein